MSEENKILTCTRGKPRTIGSSYSVTESDLWQEFKDGNKKSFEVIYKRYFNTLLNYGKKVYPVESVVEDNIQELFYELWNSRQRLSNTTSIKFYLLKSLRFKLLKEVKSSNQFVNSDFLVSAGNHLKLSVAEEKEHLASKLIEEKEKKLIDIIARLSPRQKEALFLRYFDFMTLDEISEIMGMNTQSVKNIIHRALVTIRTHYIIELGTMLVLFLTCLLELSPIL